MTDFDNFSALLSTNAPLFKEGARSQILSTSDIRQPYQRDLGRIIHSSSFRRLQAKTQVMGSGEGDFHRTRLTHSLEVAQIGRGIVWRLASLLPENQAKYLPTSELIEAICYGHDLGHPPFGHGGEQALHALMKHFGGFEGNAQTLRILTTLENYYSGQGIRPTRRLILGILKYPVSFGEYGEKAFGAKPPKCFYDEDIPLIDSALSIFSKADISKFRSLNGHTKPKFKSFDCSIMEIADDIAYGVHDLEDGIGRGLIYRDQGEPAIIKIFEDSGITKIFNTSIYEIVDKLFSNDPCLRKFSISALVGFFIEQISIKFQNEFENPFFDLTIDISSPIRRALDLLTEDIAFQLIVKQPEIATLEYKGKKIVIDLFEALSENPLGLIGSEKLNSLNINATQNIQNIIKTHGSWKDSPLTDQKYVARIICDFIASMTDRTAERYHRRLFEPGYGNSTDEI